MLQQKKLIVIYCCMLFVVSAAFSQKKSGSARAHLLYQKGASLENSKQYAEAIKCYKQAGSFFLRDKKWNEYIKSQNSLSWVYYLLDDYDSASYLLNNLLIIAKGKGKLTNTYVKLGRTYSRLDKHHESIEILKKGVDTCDLSNEQGKDDLSDCYNELSVEFWHLSKYDSTIFYQKKNISTLKLLLQPNYTKMGNSYGNMALAYWKKEQLHLAMEYFLESHRYFTLSKNDKNVGISYANLGGVSIDLHDFPIAISYFQKALPYLYENKYASGILYHNIGECFTNMKKYDSAIYYANRALDAKTNLFGKNHSTLASTYATLGTIYTGLKKYERAATYYKKALEIGKENLVANDPNLIAIYNLISQHYVERRQYSEALLFSDTAISINYLNYSNLNDISLSSMKSKREYLQSLSIRAAVYEQRENPKLAMATYENIINYYDSIVFTANHITEKHFFKEGSRKTSNALMKLYSKFHDHVDNQRKTFDLSEKNKSAVLRLSLDEVALQKSLVNNEVMRTESRLKNNLAIYQSQLLEEVQKEENDLKRVNDLKGKIFKLKRNQQNFKKDLEQNYSQYFNLKYSTKTTSIKEVQSQILKENQALVEYFLGDSSLYIFAITKTDYKIEKVNIGSSFHFHFDQFRNSLISPKLTEQTVESFEKYTSSAYYLYKKLFAPVESLIKKKDLIIVPDGKLALIPFEALLTNNPQSKNINYKTLPYLLQSHNVSYANSATTLLNSLKHISTSKNNGQVLAFAPSFDAKLMASTKLDTVRSLLGPLGWTEKEINSLTSYFKVDAYLGKLATEKIFKEKASQYEIIHIASHGLIDDQNPMHSKIAFTLDEKDTLNDGYVHTFELYNMQLNAELAVLSACNTGYGKVQKGEGVMSLGYAFAYAGVPSVVMSHWQVDDKSTYLLMNNFYKYLADGMTKSDALRKAKLALLENENIAYANPYYWGAFVVYGNDEPIQTKSILWRWYAALLLVITFLAVFYLKKVR